MREHVYVRTYVNQLDVIDWFVLVGQLLWALSFALGWSTNTAVAASGWGWCAYNYYVARKRYHPELHQ